jgi:transcriptional regulator with XRE-family HTH domain
MLTNFRVGDRVEDKKTHKRGRITFVYSELERKGEVIEVLFDGRDEVVDVPADGVRKVSVSERSAMAPRYTVATKKAPNPTDKHVGSRVRMRRKMVGMSQELLAEALGLTYQQVQKYETGANRMGASRLQQMSHVLQVPVEFFFEGAPNASEPHGSESALSVAQIDDFISDSNGLRLIGAFMRIDNAALRRRIVMLVQEIAGDDAS